MSDTIFALSSGAPPAAIAVIRISGPQTVTILSQLTGRLPAPRQASLASLRDREGLILDKALVLWLPGPRTVTGEDMAELQCHGGRAVVAAILRALGEVPGSREAQAGEFTRRAFTNGRLDLAEAEGLADLLAAETDLQRRTALAMAGGAFSTQVSAWRETVLTLSAQVEAVLDFADEDDAAGLPEAFDLDLRALASELSEWLERPRAEALHNGFRVVITGPPNAGKSTLFNALLERDAAIVTALAGTTRDVLQGAVALNGVAFTFIDTAGLRDGSDDPVEAIGIARALVEQDRADLVLWLGPQAELPNDAWGIAAQADRAKTKSKANARHIISVHTGQGMARLRADLTATARVTLPKPGDVALNQRQSKLLQSAHDALVDASGFADLLLVGECLRATRSAFDMLIGRAATEDMLDQLFRRFCIGK